MSPAARSVFSSEAPAVTPTESTILRVGGEVVEPTEISRVSPVFPTTCGKSRFQGLFIFEATIDSQGTVTNVKTLRGISARPPCPERETECKRALSLWRYKPATLRGVPVPVYLTITLSFHFR
jgi:hypothetical protein